MDSNRANLNSLNHQDFHVPGLEIIKKIGEGGQASVYRAVYNSKFVCAKKYIRKGCFEKELKMLTAAQSSGCVPEIYGKFSNEGQYVILMELIEGKNLEDLLNENPSNKLIHEITYKLFKAIKKLHSTRVIHNDLKLDNVMVELRKSNCSVKIIDLGVATYHGESPYPGVPSEIFPKVPHLDPSLAMGGPCSAATDLYSLGRIMFNIQKYSKCKIYKKCQKRLYSHRSHRISRKKLLERKCKVCTKNRKKLRVNADSTIELE